MSNDTITLEIIQNSIQAAADEMFAAMRKTAMSSIIYEVLDMGTGITDAQGRLASSGAGIPAFVGVLDKSVQFILEKFGEDIVAGDVFITNDPWHGGVTHLNDLVLAMPVFANDQLIGWTANIAHNSDVGGMAPGSLSGEATEIFQEGLRLPAVKLIRAGDTDQSVMDIITCIFYSVMFGLPLHRFELVQNALKNSQANMACKLIRLPLKALWTLAKNLQMT